MADMTAMPKHSFPFCEEHELKFTLQSSGTLPGYPHFLLQNTEELYTFLSEDLCTPTLEKISPYLWWMSKQSSAHISPLHHQAVKSRKIVVSENPELHLIWHYDRIFIKPMPKYLLSHAFWKDYMIRSVSSNFVGVRPARSLTKSALGLLRTYRYLVKYQSDFDIAKEMGLIPREATWETLSNFLSDLKSIDDSHVNERWHYGEIRLTRLNFYIKFLLGRSTFHKVHGQYRTYFSRFAGPLLFSFGMISVLLNAVQVELNVEPLIANQWPRFWALSRWLAIAFAAFVFLVLILLFLVFIRKFAAEWYFALRDRRRFRGNLHTKTQNEAGGRA